MLTKENYYEDKNYMSASQFKDFKFCEAQALAKIKGEWKDKSNPAYLIGSYIDAYFSNELEKFKFENPEIFNRDGSLKAQFKQADLIIERIKQDDYMMHLLSGQTQLIETGVIADVPFKIKMDSVLEDCIVDQKIMKDCKDIWNDGSYQPFWKVYGYDSQLAIYQYIHAQNCGIKKDCKLAVATKEDATDLRVFKFTDETLKNAFLEVFNLAPRYDAIKKGIIEPTYCGKCAYCRSLKKLSVNDEENI